MQKVKKIDIHVHTISSRGIMRDTGDTYALPDELIEMYDKVGIERGTLLPEINMECAYDSNTNREIQQIASQNPARFSWFCNIDPRMGSNSPNANLDYFVSYYKSQGARGVGEISANMYFDSPMMLNLFKSCEKFEMPIIFHIGRQGNDYGVVDDFGLPHLENMLKACPKLRVLGHSQKFWACISGDVTEELWNRYPTGKITPGGRLIELMRKYPNLCCDLSAGSGHNAITRDPEFTYSFFEEFADRIYFGTDICSPLNITNPMLKTAEFLDEAMESGNISYDTYYKISRGNAEKLLGLAK